jgi:hypothetical protein
MNEDKSGWEPSPPVWIEAPKPNVDGLHDWPTFKVIALTLAIVSFAGMMIGASRTEARVSTLTCLNAAQNSANITNVHDVTHRGQRIYFTREDGLRMSYTTRPGDLCVETVVPR